MSGRHKLEGKNGIVALKMLEDVSAVLEKNHIEFWLESGTLLGIVRENRLLPWDNDVDISIKEEYVDKLLSSLSEISSLGYRVRSKTFENDSSPFKKGVTRIVKIRNNRFFFFRGKVTLDIYIKFKKDDKYYYQCGQTKKASSAAFYEELEEITFNTKKYKIPSDHEAYLTCKYGNWKVVDKKWNAFKDDNVIVGNV